MSKTVLATVLCALVASAVMGIGILVWCSQRPEEQLQVLALLSGPMYVIGALQCLYVLYHLIRNTIADALVHQRVATTVGALVAGALFVAAYILMHLTLLLHAWVVVNLITTCVLVVYQLRLITWQYEWRHKSQLDEHLLAMV